MSFKVLAGDFTTGNGSFMFGHFTLYATGQESWIPKSTSYTMRQVTDLQEINESNKVSVLGATGWGTLGAVALGPVGLLAGMVLGGRGKSVVFAVEFDDGKKALIQCSNKVWTKIIAAKFNATT